MSSILKALQKLEKDKETRKTREPDISTAIKMSGIRSKEYQAWLVPSIVVIVAAVSILVTFSLMGGFSSQRQTTVQPGQQPVQQQESPAIHVQREPSSTSIESTVSSEQPGVFSPVQIGRNPPSPPVPSVPVPQVSPSPSKTTERTTAPPPEPLQEQPPAPPEEIPPAPKPKLVVTGIAWQSDTASRIAVVNGSSVSEGSSVGGARVEQIFPDRVRFLQGGSSFELFLNQGN